MTAPAARLPRVRASELLGRGWLNTGGEPISLVDLRGRVVVLDFWTFCCINCLHVLDELREVEQRCGDALVVIGVHSPKFVHEADPDALAAAVQRYEVHHPVLDDPELVTWRAYTARAWPTLVVIDPEGYVVAQMAGEGHGPAVAALVEQLVAEHEAKGTLRRGPGPYVPPAPTPGVLSFPAKAIALDDGRLLVADAGHHSLAILDCDATTLVGRIGSGERGWADGRPDEARFAEPNGLCLVADELRERLGYDVLVADTANHLLRGVRLSDGTVTTVAGTGKAWVVGGPDNEPFGDGEWAKATTVPRQTRLSSPWDVAWSQSLAAFVVAMAGTHTLWEFDDEESSLRLLSGTMNEGLQDGAPDEAWFAQPSGLAVAEAGAVWVADAETSALRVLDPATRQVSSVIGAGLFDFGHRDGTADQALLQHPLGVAALPDGSVLIADTYNGAVRRYLPAAPGGAGEPVAGCVETVASGLAEPSGLVVQQGADGGLSVLVVESAAHRLTRLPLSAGDLVDHGAHRTARPVTDVGQALRLDVPFTPAPGQALDERYGPSTRLRVSATPARLLLDGGGDGTDLVRELRLAPGEGVLHVTAHAASCDKEAEHPACHLATQDWGVPIRVLADGPATLVLPLRG